MLTVLFPVAGCPGPCWGLAVGAESSNLERLMFNLLLAELGGGALSPETGNTGTTYTMKTESHLKSGLHTYTPETH